MLLLEQSIQVFLVIQHHLKFMFIKILLNINYYNQMYYMQLQQYHPLHQVIKMYLLQILLYNILYLVMDSFQII